MTELEIMQHAKSYLDKLAKGFDPLTGQEVPENDVVNKARISRCLLYASDILRQVIENGGVIGAPVKRGELASYTLPYEARSRYAFGDWPFSASQIAQRLNELTDQSTMQKLKTTSITKFLLRSGLLFEEVGPSGNKNKRPTEAGKRLGISTAQRMGKTANIPPWSMTGRRSSSFWTIWTRSSPSTPSRATRTRASRGRRRRTPGCVRRFRRAWMSRRCRPNSNAPAPPSGQGLRNWD